MNRLCDSLVEQIKKYAYCASRGSSGAEATNELKDRLKVLKPRKAPYHDREDKNQRNVDNLPPQQKNNYN